MLMWSVQTGSRLHLGLLSLPEPDAGPTQRRFAIAETLAHLEYLVASGGAARTGRDPPVQAEQREQERGRAEADEPDEVVT